MLAPRILLLFRRRPVSSRGTFLTPLFVMMIGVVPLLAGCTTSKPYPAENVVNISDITKRCVVFQDISECAALDKKHVVIRGRFEYNRNAWYARFYPENADFSSEDYGRLPMLSFRSKTLSKMPRSLSGYNNKKILVTGTIRTDCVADLTHTQWMNNSETEKDFIFVTLGFCHTQGNIYFENFSIRLAPSSEAGR
jgi:hypothetical protein